MIRGNGSTVEVVILIILFAGMTTSCDLSDNDLQEIIWHEEDLNDLVIYVHGLDAAGEYTLAIIDVASGEVLKSNKYASIDDVRISLPDYAIMLNSEQLP